MSYTAFLGHVALFPNGPAVRILTEKPCVGSVLVRETHFEMLFI